jgi:hypothetical protein
MDRRLLWVSVGGVLAVFLLGVSQPMTLRSDGVQFPDGTVQTTAAISVGTPISAAPVVISEPGYYYFTNNIGFGDSGANAIEVNASGVTIDLMGFTLSNTGAADVGILANQSRVEVRNGAIKDFLGSGIKSYGEEARAVGLRVSDNSWGIVLLGPQGFVRDCTVTHNGLAGGGEGIGLNVGGVAIDNVVANCGLGIYALAGGFISGNNVDQCGVGIYSELDHSYVFNNLVICSGCVGGDGIGIRVSSDTRVSDNTVAFSTAKNIYVVGARNAIEHNLMTSSPVGLAFAVDGNFYSDNRVSGCTTPWDLGTTSQTDGGGNVAF